MTSSHEPCYLSYMLVFKFAHPRAVLNFDLVVCGRFAVVSHSVT